jgi:hypothetical protein
LPLSSGSKSCSRCNGKVASVATSSYELWRISPVALERGKWNLSSSNHTKSLPLSLETGKATHSTNRKQGNDENSFWLVRKFWNAANGNYKPAIPKEWWFGTVSVLCGSHKNFKGPLIVKGREWKVKVMISNLVLYFLHIM